MHYKVGVVSGKFRILHEGHKEVLLKATKEDIDKLVVVCHVNPKYKRYSEVKYLKKAIEDILKPTKKPYEIILTYDTFNDIISWEQYIIEAIGHDDILMFNSKEDYENILLPNKFIKCENVAHISASNIEKKLKNKEEVDEVAEEFQPYFHNE